MGTRRLFENKYVVAVPRSGQVFDCLVHGDQDSGFLYGESEQAGVRYLLMPEDSLQEGIG